MVFLFLVCHHFLRILTRFIDIKNLLPVFFRLIVSVAWIAHIVIYLLISPPLSPFLNEVFIKLDDIWGTFRIYFSCLYVVIILLNGYDFDMLIILHQVFWALLHLHSSASTSSLQSLLGL